MTASQKKWAVAAAGAAAVTGFFLLDLHHTLTLETVKANRDRLLAFTNEHYAAAAASFIVLYCAIVAFSLPAAALMTLTGGFLFGTVAGALFVNIGATTGATLAFLASRYVLRDWVERRFGAWLDPIQDGFKRNAFSYLITLRLIPLIPFFVINLLSGLTRVGVGTYAAATAIGIIPGTLVFAYAGRQLGTLDSLKGILSPNVLTAFGLLILLSLVPVFYRKLTEPRHAA
ncbi:MAG TPA: TVP38/TMEM64 family protein [Nitrospirales bacterium]|nr:TVP38/TMEM64 family protein [Nitrospirales bacterium]